MIFGYFTLFVALTISAVAEFYSIVGLTAIFSAAFWPIVIMGACLGVGKVTAAVWLKLNWERASWTYKLYLVPAVAFLMVLTSMGIFGFLSKAHSDQSMVSGDSMAKVAIYDEKIKTAKDNIDANRKALKQMDEAVDQVMGRSADEKGAEKAVAIRRGQTKERTRLLSEITAEQKVVAQLSEERAPLAAEFRKVEAEVGPIKYIAALVYGDNPDANILEKAVRLVIILIVAVFDPLALVLILAAQQSLRWAKEERDAPKYEPDDIPLTEDQVEQLKETVELFKEEPVVEKSVFESHPYLLKPFSHFTDTTPIVAKTEDVERTVVASQSDYVDAEVLNTYNDERLMSKFDKMDLERPGDYITPPDDDIMDEEHPRVKEAMARWKAEHPGETLKSQRYKLMRGEIEQLPWMGLLADNELPPKAKSGFGAQFPVDPVKGDSFVRVDQYPNAVYKYNGHDWIVVDKNLADSYTYDSAYIDHLIAKISSGEYDPDMLSDSESEQVAERLQQNSNPNA